MKVVIMDLFFLFYMMWRNIMKIIDRLYLVNYKDLKCKNLYEIDVVVVFFFGYNIMVIEYCFGFFVLRK